MARIVIGALDKFAGDKSLLYPPGLGHAKPFSVASRSRQDSSHVQHMERA